MVAFFTDTMICGFSLYQIFAYFLVYSCIGWCLEVIYAAVSTGQLVNRGFLNGPVCPIYGFGMIIVLFLLTPLQHSLLLLYIGGVMEHIEEAGVHSGDSSCTLPPVTLGHDQISQVREATEAIARVILRDRPRCSIDVRITAHDASPSVGIGHRVARAEFRRCRVGSGDRAVLGQFLQS